MKTVPGAAAISFSPAFSMSATAAMALPPHTAVTARRSWAGVPLYLLPFSRKPSGRQVPRIAEMVKATRYDPHSGPRRNGPSGTFGAPFFRDP